MSKQKSKPRTFHQPANAAVIKKAEIPARVLTNGYAAIKQCRLGWFMFNTNDNYIGKSLDIYGEWCEPEMELLAKVIRPGSLVVDVGANIGTHSVFFGKVVGPGGMVYSLEPQRIQYEFLCANLVLNNLTNVIPIHAGAGEENTSIHVPVLDPNKVMNFGCLQIEGHNTGDVVPIIRLDDLKLSGCNLIKIDVEGMEMSVLRGAAGILEKKRPAVFCENNSRQGSSEVVQFLTDAGYRMWWQIAAYYNPNNYFHNPENIWPTIQPEANMICIPKEVQVNADWLQPVTGPDDNWIAALERMGIKVNLV